MMKIPKELLNAPPPFSGFTKETFTFLRGLKRNNNRDWFNARKNIYEAELKAPMQSLVAALAIAFRANDIPLVADPKKSIFRIYRDIRFSKNKNPYKTHIAAYFPYRSHAKTFVDAYIHFTPGESFIAGGVYESEPDALRAMRKKISSHHKDLEKIIFGKKFLKTFGTLSGETLSRPPAGFEKEDPAIDLIKHKQFLVTHRLTEKEVLSGDLPEILCGYLGQMLPFLEFFATA